MQNKRTTLLATLTLILLAACGGLSSKQKTAAQDAIAALRKIEAAVQVGVNYQQYGLLLIDAKSKVNDANAVLPDGELKNRLNAAMDAYADAAQAWNTKISSSISLKPDTEPGATLMRKYNLKSNSVKVADREFVYIDADNAMQTIWGAALGHLLIAHELLNKQ